MSNHETLEEKSAALRGLELAATYDFNNDFYSSLINSDGVIEVEADEKLVLGALYYQHKEQAEEYTNPIAVNSRLDSLARHYIDLHGSNSSIGNVVIGIGLFMQRTKNIGEYESHLRSQRISDVLGAISDALNQPRYIID